MRPSLIEGRTNFDTMKSSTYDELYCSNSNSVAAAADPTTVDDSKAISEMSAPGQGQKRLVRLHVTAHRPAARPALVCVIQAAQREDSFDRVSQHAEPMQRSLVQPHVAAGNSPPPAASAIVCVVRAAQRRLVRSHVAACPSVAALVRVVQAAQREDSFDRASQQAEPTQRSLVQPHVAAGNLINCALRHAPLSPLLFASSRQREEETCSIVCRGAPPCRQSCPSRPGDEKVTRLIARHSALPCCHSCLRRPGRAKETRLIARSPPPPCCFCSCRSIARRGAPPRTAHCSR